MTDKIKDILTQIKGRFSNPLIFSFLCSWLVINWEITVSLIWYSEGQFNKPNQTVFNFISDKINSWNGLWQPLIVAILYTLLSPIIRNIIRALYTSINKRGENWVLKISKGGNIPIEKYLNLRGEYKKRTDFLEEIIKNESEVNILNQELNDKLLILGQEKNSLQSQLNKNNSIINSLNDSTFLNGTWNKKSQDSKIPDQRIQIYNKDYRILNLNQSRIEYRIENYFYNIITKELFFILKKKVSTSTGGITEISYSTNNLRVESIDYISGYENNDLATGFNKSVSVVYEKVINPN